MIEFSATIRPICLPFRPIDDDDHLETSFVNSASWANEGFQSTRVNKLHFYNLKVTTRLLQILSIPFDSER